MGKKEKERKSKIAGEQKKVGGIEKPIQKANKGKKDNQNKVNKQQKKNDNKQQKNNKKQQQQKNDKTKQQKKQSLIKKKEIKDKKQETKQKNNKKNKKEGEKKGKEQKKPQQKQNKNKEQNKDKKGKDGKIQNKKIKKDKNNSTNQAKDLGLYDAKQIKKQIDALEAKKEKGEKIPKNKLKRLQKAFIKVQENKGKGGDKKKQQQKGKNNNKNNSEVKGGFKGPVYVALYHKLSSAFETSSEVLGVFRDQKEGEKVIKQKSEDFWKNFQQTKKLVAKQCKAPAQVKPEDSTSQVVSSYKFRAPDFGECSWYIAKSTAN